MGKVGGPKMELPVCSIGLKGRENVLHKTALICSYYSEEQGCPHLSWVMKHYKDIDPHTSSPPLQQCASGLLTHMRNARHPRAYPQIHKQIHKDETETHKLAHTQTHKLCDNKTGR